MRYFSIRHCSKGPDLQLTQTYHLNMKPASLRPFLPRSALRRRQPRTTRHYALQNPGAPMLQVFNDHTKHLQRERAAADPVASRRVDYLRDEVATRLCERLLVRTLST